MYKPVQIQKNFSHHERSRMISNIHKHQESKSEYKVEKQCILGSPKFCRDAFILCMHYAFIMHSQSNHSLCIHETTIHITHALCIHYAFTKQPFIMHSQNHHSLQSNAKLMMMNE